MADPVSLTASIIAIVTVGFQVAKGLHQVADGIGRAGKQVRQYADEISGFSQLLSHIKEHLLPPFHNLSAARGLIKDVLDVCDKVLEPLQRLQSTLGVFFARFKHSPRKLRQFCRRVRWVFGDKDELLFYMDSLRAHHRILDSALHLTNLEATEEKTAPSIFIIKMALEDSISGQDMARWHAPRGRRLAVVVKNEPQSSNLLQSTGQVIPVLRRITGVTEELPVIDGDLNSQSAADSNTRDSSEEEVDQETGDELNLFQQQINEDLDPDCWRTIIEVWQDTDFLARKVKRLASDALFSPGDINASSSPSGPVSARIHNDYTVGWVCTRPIEYAAAEGMLDEEHPALPQIEANQNTYTLGAIGKHNIVLLCVPAEPMDTSVASTAISEMLRTFPNIRIRLFVGIGNAVFNDHTDIRLGDVVVGSPASPWAGLVLLDRSGQGIVETGSLETPPRNLSNALATLQGRHIRRDTEITQYIKSMLATNPSMRDSFSAPGRETDLLFISDYEHSGTLGCHCCDPQRIIPRSEHSGKPTIHYGPIGWTKSTVRTGKERDEFAFGRRIYSLERESIGLINFFPCLVIRGIWSYSDSHPNPRWQRYAAATAAGYAKEVLETI